MSYHWQFHHFLCFFCCLISDIVTGPNRIGQYGHCPKTQKTGKNRKIEKNGKIRKIKKLGKCKMEQCMLGLKIVCPEAHCCPLYIMLTLNRYRIERILSLSHNISKDSDMYRRGDTYTRKSRVQT